MDTHTHMFRTVTASPLAHPCCKSKDHHRGVVQKRGRAFSACAGAVRKLPRHEVRFPNLVTFGQPFLGMFVCPVGVGRADAHPALPASQHACHTSGQVSSRNRRDDGVTRQSALVPLPPPCHTWSHGHGAKPRASDATFTSPNPGMSATECCCYSLG